MLSCEFCEIFKEQLFFIEHLWWLLLFLHLSVNSLGLNFCYSYCCQRRSFFQIIRRLNSGPLYEKNGIFPLNLSKTKTTNCRNSRLQLFFKISVLKNFAIFTGKHLMLELLDLNTCIQQRDFLFLFSSNISVAASEFLVTT